MVILAGDEARELRHSHIGSEHILLGLLGEAEGLAARVLGSLDIRLEDVRSQVMCIVAAGQERAVGKVPFTPRAERALELALREALSLGQNYVGTEHVLFGLVREADGVGVRILRDLGADPRKVCDAVMQVVSRAPVAAGPPVRTRAGVRADPGVMPIDRAWLGAIGGFLPGLSTEIRQQLHP